MRIAVNATELKKDHNLPIAVSARCSCCYPMLLQLQAKGLIPADKDLRTIFVDRTGLFAYRCVNSRCPEKSKFETLKCFLRHRDFSLAEMEVNLKDGVVWVDMEGNPDLDHPEMDNYITLKYGPIRDCTGHLEWANSRDINDGAEWLICSDCSASYRSYIFTWYDKITNDLHYAYGDYELIPTNNKEPWKIHKKEAWVKPVEAYPIPRDWLLAITEVRDNNGSTFFTLRKT